MKYRMLAVDMDFTALNARKEITPRTEDAIHRALAAGYEVVFATGRGQSEMRQYMGSFPDMHYAMLYAGGMILDLRTGERLREIKIPPETVRRIEQIVQKYDTYTAYFVGGEVCVDKTLRDKLEEYHIGEYRESYDYYAVWEDVAGENFRRDPDSVHKTNVYFRHHAEWCEAWEQIKALGLTVASTMPEDCEISPVGVNKGVGLRMLCDAVGIPPEQTIVCGDGGNDFDMMRTGGFRVAMANALDEIKEIADFVTGDCEHDGVADVIDRFLLGEENR